MSRLSSGWSCEPSSRGLFSHPTDGARVVPGNGLEAILAEEEAFAEEASDATTAARTGLVWGAVFAVALSLGVGSLVYFRYGREPKVDYDREYEQEPPTDLKPAEVGALHAGRGQREGVHRHDVRSDPAGGDQGHAITDRAKHLGWPA